MFRFRSKGFTVGNFLHVNTKRDTVARMGRRKKQEVVSNHAGRFLVTLRHRAGLSVRDVAAKIGKSRQAVHVAEVRTHHASMDVIMAVAHACGATLEELDRLPALTALDKGALVVPRGTTVERVKAAMACLGARYTPKLASAARARTRTSVGQRGERMNPRVTSALVRPDDSSNQAPSHSGFALACAR